MLKENKLRVILDTNLWISFLISKKLKRMDSLFEKDNIILIFSHELLEEFIEVAERPKFRKYFSESDLINVLNLFDVYGELVDVDSKIEFCRDPKDNFLLSLAKDAKADYLLTGDEDLLVIKKFEKTEIITYTAFENITTLD